MTPTEIDHELRTRGWIETNCAHCHNRDGLAQSTGVFFDMFRRVNLNYGICKSPTTAGQLVGRPHFDIVPGRGRLDRLVPRSLDRSERADAADRAQRVAQRGVAILDAWIDDVVDERYEGSGCQ